MAAAQTTIALIFDYDQTLSLQLHAGRGHSFPAYGIDGKIFWNALRTTSCANEGYESELAYMKVLLDTLEMDRPSNAPAARTRREADLLSRPAGDVPGVRNVVCSARRTRPHLGIGVEYYIHFQRPPGDHRGQPVASVREGEVFGCEYGEDSFRPHLISPSA